MEMLARLVAAPSVSSVNPDFDGGNREVIDLLAGWLGGLGFAIEVIPVSASPEKANLIATAGSGTGGLVLAGHADTVPCAPDLWTRDPYRLAEEDGRYYGLGTADMKGFLALAVEAAKSVAGHSLRRPLTLVVTADEESTMNGARLLVEFGRPRARYALIGEPTGLTPVRLHKGIAMEALVLEGREGHSSNPALGRNAIDGMHTALGIILAWRSRLVEGLRDEAFEVPTATLNLGRIHGGDNPNRICGRCELHYDLRLLPGMDLEALRADLREQLERGLAGSGLVVRMHNLDVAVPAFTEDPGCDWVRELERRTGREARSAPFGSEAPFFQQLGMQTALLGPGDLAQAHQPDEFLRADRAGPTLNLLTGLIHEICVAPVRLG
jgi:acetylornithine deacetylase